MPNNENNNTIITDLKFGNNIYEIGLGTTTREELESIFEDINSNFEDLNTTIEDNEETISSSLNDLEIRKADKVDIPTVPTNVSAFTNDAGYLTQHQSLSDYATKDWVEGKNYLTQHQDISEYFNDVEYDSNSKRINFKNGNTVKKYIDATDFIKDGMVDSVTIGNVTIDNVSTKCLIITFNTDSGKENINIPLTDIFDPDEYYTKDDIDDTEKTIAAALTDLDSRINTLNQDVQDLKDSDNTVTEALEEINENITNLSENVDGLKDSEKVTAASLNDLNTRIGKVTNDITALQSSDEDFTERLVSLDNRVDTLDDSIETVSNDVDDLKNSEKVTAASLNDLNSRITTLNGDVQTVQDSTEALTHSLTDLQGTVGVLGNDVQGLKDSEKVASSALNDINTRIGGLSENVETLSQTTETVSSAVTAIDGRVKSLETFVDDAEDTEMAISAAINDLEKRKADKTDIPTNISSFTNDAGYLTTHQDISGKADKMLLVNHGTSDTTFELTPNTKHVWGEVSSLTITLGTEISGIVNVFYFQFDSGSTATTLSLPASVKWNYDEQLVVLPNTRYQISIEGEIATVGFASLT